MNTYIALLRGINVGGKNKTPMAELRKVLLESGLRDVKTYIQSGNIVFQSLEEKEEKLELDIHEVIKSHFGFEIPILVKTPRDFERIFNNCPFPEDVKRESYFILLFSVPRTSEIKTTESISYPNESFYITDECVYLHCSTGYGKAKMSNNFFERKLKISATARNFRTMEKLLALAE